MQDFLRFEKELLEIVGDGHDLRPFICEGSPLLCDVFIVGYNPATATGRQFLSYWEPGYGMRRSDVLGEIRAIRATQKTKTGRSKAEFSHSRMTIHVLIAAGEELGEFRCLETNIYAAEAPAAGDVKAHQRVTRHFDFLLDWVKPKVIISHGKKANAYLRTKALDAEWLTIETHFRSRPYAAARAAAQVAQRIVQSSKHRVRAIS